MKLLNMRIIAIQIRLMRKRAEYIIFDKIRNTDVLNELPHQCLIFEIIVYLNERSLECFQNFNK